MGERRIAITISGLAGSGTTTTANLVAAILRWPYVNAGEIARKACDRRGMDIRDWPAIVAAEPRVDTALDRLLEKTIVRGRVIVEGRHAGVVAQGCAPRRSLRVWLDAPPDVRAERVSERDGGSLAFATEELRIRDSATQGNPNYLPPDTKGLYALKVDTTEFPPVAVAEAIVAAARRWRPSVWDIRQAALRDAAEQLWQHIWGEPWPDGLTVRWVPYIHRTAGMATVGGICTGGSIRISWSHHCANPDDVIDTVVHEFIHARGFRRHDARFREVLQSALARAHCVSP